MHTPIKKKKQTTLILSPLILINFRFFNQNSLNFSPKSLSTQYSINSENILLIIKCNYKFLLKDDLVLSILFPLFHYVRKQFPALLQTIISLACIHIYIFTYATYVNTLRCNCVCMCVCVCASADAWSFIAAVALSYCAADKKSCMHFTFCISLVESARGHESSSSSSE